MHLNVPTIVAHELPATGSPSPLRLNRKEYAPILTNRRRNQSHLTKCFAGQYAAIAECVAMVYIITMTSTMTNACKLQLYHMTPACTVLINRSAVIQCNNIYYVGESAYVVPLHALPSPQIITSPLPPRLPLPPISSTILFANVHGVR